MNDSYVDNNVFLEFPWNETFGNTSTVVPKPALRWGVLGILFIIFFSAMGNLLVCLAVCWERRLQNMTNYFLMSLAIADLLVSLIVMPVGMVVELYGFFPMDAELCVLWVSSDVLMCTASIWHMCTMSMDRFFTLKYPMRYGRNKTKTMVLLKILFVWVISVAVSSPLCIHGFIDNTVVFNNGVCVPTLKHFVIYGSVFAFYIPLLIMIATYILTIRILWKNQKLMKRIERSDMRPKLNQINQTFAGIAIPQLITPMRVESPTGQRVTFPDSSIRTYQNQSGCQDRQPMPCVLSPLSPSRPLLAHSPVGSPVSPLHSTMDTLHYSLPSPLCSESEDEQDTDTACSRHLLKRRSNSYRTLGHSPQKRNLFRTRSKESIYNPSFEKESEQVMIKVEEDKNNLTVPERVFYKKRRSSGLYQTKSDTQIPELCAGSKVSSRQTSLSFNRLDDCNFTSAEWECRFLQIQQEMDQCIMDAEREIHPSKEESLTAKETDSNLTACESLIKESLRPFCLSLPPAKPAVKQTDSGNAKPAIIDSNTSDNVLSDDSDDEEDDSTRLSSSPSDTIPIRIQSPPESPRVPKLDGTVLNGLIASSEKHNNLVVSDTDQYDSADNTNVEDDTDDTLSTNIRPSHRLKERFRATLRASIRRPLTKHLLSKKTATNERKASKVLGIIFLVFVVLWTPFFIMNIVSVTCDNCMADVTATMMSVILWMGYTASLANPIIYTMFNTAFRKTFIKILTCKLGHRTSKYRDPVHMSCTTMMNSDRRGTMTVVIKDDSR